MTTLDIIEENFSHSDYVAYLRGRIIMYLLEDKPLDTVEFKMYADKLVDALDKEQPNQQDYKIDVYRQTITPQIKSFDYTKEEPTVDHDELQVQPTIIDEPKAYKFKIGDRVIVCKGTVDELTGTIIRLPREGSTSNKWVDSSYVVELDDKTFGWEATVEDEGVSCGNAWYAFESNLTPLELHDGFLQVDKWYHTKDFTMEELQKLLPGGTTIETEAKALYSGIETTPPEDTITAIVEDITPSILSRKPFIEVTSSNFLKEWFKIQENK